MSGSTAKLVVLEGKHAGRVFQIKGPSVMGRMKGIAVPVPDTKVSREHSKIFPQGADFYIVDLNSSNGTLVNDAPITRRLLRDGDEILLGATRFRFELEAAEPAAPAADATPTGTPAAGTAPVREVVDLTSQPSATPAGAIRAEEIVVKDRALQFSKKKSRKRPSLFFDDLGQKNFAYQLIIFLVVAVAAVVFLLIGLRLGGVIGGG